MQSGVFRHALSTRAAFGPQRVNEIYRKYAVNRIIFVHNYFVMAMSCSEILHVAIRVSIDCRRSEQGSSNTLPRGRGLRDNNSLSNSHPNSS